jgi:hypothetical protein
MKRKIVVEDLERHAKEVSGVNQTLTHQLESLTGQLERAISELNDLKRRDQHHPRTFTCQSCGQSQTDPSSKQSKDV